MASNIVFDGTKGISLPSFTTTEKNAIVSPATGATVFDTTQNRQNVYAGGAWNAGLNSGTAQASTSGTSIDFTGIPSWVKRITVMFSDVSTNGTSVPMIQVGSGSLTTSGYLGSVSLAINAASTVAALMSTGHFIVATNGATDTLHGQVMISLLGSNKYVISGLIGYSNGAAVCHSASSIALSGVLDRVRITTYNGTDTFDAGSINILYE